MPTPKKNEEVKILKEKLGKAVTVVVTDYKGLTVAEVTELRKKFREKQVDYLVAKNTLIIKAIEQLDFPNIDEFLKGPTAIAISYDDPVAPVKITNEFIKNLPETRKLLKIKTGIFDGKVLSKSEISTLAELPSKEELLARLVRAFNGPVQGFVNVTAGTLRSFVNVINALKNKKEETAN